MKLYFGVTTFKSSGYLPRNICIMSHHIWVDISPIACIQAKSNTAEKRLRMRQHYWNLYCERDVKCSECCEKLKMEATSMFCLFYENTSGIMNVTT
jgi:hypothetical protein